MTEGYVKVGDQEVHEDDIDEAVGPAMVWYVDESTNELYVMDDEGVWERTLGRCEVCAYVYTMNILCECEVARGKVRGLFRE